MIVIIQTAIQGLGLISILIAIYQFYSSNRWKRIEYSMNGPWYKKLDAKENEILEDYSFDYGKTSISDDEYAAIIENRELYEKIIKYLNIFEEIASLYEINAIDKEYAYSNYSSRLIQTYEYFERIIKNVRKRDNDESEYYGISHLYLLWKRKTLKMKRKDIRKLNREYNEIGKIIEM